MLPGLSQTCLVKVRIGSMPAFDMQFYGITAEQLLDEDTRIEIVAAALLRRGFDLVNSSVSFSVGLPARSPVKARNDFKRMSK
jgi:hypothetical protein